MKAGKNKPSKEQKEWINSLQEEGYVACVCYGWLEAREVIEKYLSEPRNFIVLGVDKVKREE